MNCEWRVVNSEEEENWTHVADVIAAVRVAAFAATRVATSDASVRTHEVALSIADVSAAVIAASEA